MKRVAYYPFDLSDPNLYTARMCRAIRMSRADVEVVPFCLSFRLYRFRKSDVYWLNWYENMQIKSKIRIFRYLVLKIFYLFLMKLCGGKVVVTIHNKRPHEMPMERLNLWFMRYLLHRADKIVVLCEESIACVNELMHRNISKKICKVLHPTYDCIPKVYPEKPKDKFTVLFFGLLRPYKNVELILDIAKEHPEMDFLIAGRPVSEEYVVSLRQQAEGLGNVNFDFKFLEDREINDLMDKSSILILPYHLQSTLNSGVAMYAFSKGINVVMPQIGTILELENKIATFSYRYLTEGEHRKAMENQLCEAYRLYSTDYSEFVRRANVLRNEVLRRNSLEAISWQIGNVLK